MMRVRFRFFAVFFALLAAFASLDASATLQEDFSRLEQSLRLKPAQKAQYDIAVAATQRALLSSALSANEFRERLKGELLKNRPDLATIFAAQEALVEQNRPLFRSARDEWLRLYALLDEEQVRIARDFVEQKLSRLEGFLESLRAMGTGV
jgi:hypothetical protein